MECDESLGMVCDNGSDVGQVVGDDSGQVVGGDDSGNVVNLNDSCEGSISGCPTTPTDSQLGGNESQQTNTSVSVAINDSLQTAGGNIFNNFIQLLPVVAILIGILFIIKFVNYWLTKMKGAK